MVKWGVGRGGGDCDQSNGNIELSSDPSGLDVTLPDRGGQLPRLLTATGGALLTPGGLLQNCTLSAILWQLV